mgnify:CR=1 FL=1
MSAHQNEAYGFQPRFYAPHVCHCASLHLALLFTRANRIEMIISVSIVNNGRFVVKWTIVEKDESNDGLTFCKF